MHDNTDYENMLRVSNKVCRLNEIGQFILLGGLTGIVKIRGTTIGMI